MLCISKIDGQNILSKPRKKQQLWSVSGENVKQSKNFVIFMEKKQQEEQKNNSRLTTMNGM